jgi:hypothetical protein
MRTSACSCPGGPRNAAAVLRRGLGLFARVAIVMLLATPVSHAQAAPRDAAPAVGGDSVVGVFFDSRARLDITTPGIEYWTHTIFRNGTACYKCFNVWAANPGALVAYASSHAEDFGAWRQVGDQLVITYADGLGPKSHALRDVFRPGSSALRLNAVLTNGAGSDSELTEDYFGFLRFGADGRFSWLKEADESQTRRALTGRYAVNGFRIAFIYDDGRSATYSFAADPKHTRFVIINGTPYYEHSDRP